MSIAVNKKARFEYEILETFQAGIKLSGPEVKSVRAGHVQLVGSYVIVRGTHVSLLNAHISPYKPASLNNAEPTRSRDLLLRKSEIEKITRQVEGGMTCVPLSVYLKNNLIKVEVAIAKGKKLHDKRKTIKEREGKREAQRVVKYQQ